MKAQQLEFFNQEPQPPAQPAVQEAPVHPHRAIGAILENLGVPNDPKIIAEAISALERVSSAYQQEKKLAEHNKGYVRSSWMQLASHQKPSWFTDHQWQAFNGKRKEIYHLLHAPISPRGKA